MSETPRNPWADEAMSIVGDDAIIGDGSLARLRRDVANALARSYEYGFAQGRLAEIDLARAATEAADALERGEPDCTHGRERG